MRNVPPDLYSNTNFNYCNTNFNFSELEVATVVYTQRTALQKSKQSYYFGSCPSIIIENACSSPTGSDGELSFSGLSWIKRPHIKKDCPRHWRLFAKKKFHAFKEKIPEKNFYYHVRLSCMMQIQKGTRFQNLTKWRNKVENLPNNDAKVIFSCWHASKGRDHLHVLVGSNQEYDLNLLRQFWQEHFPAKKLMDWHHQFVMAKKHNHPRRLLWYVLLGRKKKPRKLAPWMHCAARSPLTFWL